MNAPNRTHADIIRDAKADALEEASAALDNEQTPEEGQPRDPALWLILRADAIREGRLA